MQLWSCPHSSQYNTLPTRPKNLGSMPQSQSFEGDSRPPLHHHHHTLPHSKSRSLSVQVENVLPNKPPEQVILLNKPRRSSQAEVGASGIKLSTSAENLDRGVFNGGTAGGGGLGSGNGAGGERLSFRDSGIEQSPRSSTSGNLSAQSSPPNAGSNLFPAGSMDRINGSNESSLEGNKTEEQPPPVPVKKSRQLRTQSLDFLDVSLTVGICCVL